MAGKESVVAESYFSFHFKVLRIFGIPIEKKEPSRFDKLYTLYACTLYFMLCLFILLELVEIFVDFNVEDFSFALSYIISHCLAMAKATLVLVFRKNIREICKRIETERFLPDPRRGGQIENVYIQNAISTSNKLAFCFHVFVVVIVSQRCIYGMTGEDQFIYDEETNTNRTVRIRAKAFICYFPFDTNESPVHEIITVWETCCAGFMGYIIGATDALIYGFMCHIKAQFLILFRSLETFLDRAERLMLEDGIEVNLQKYKSPVYLPNGMAIIEKLPKEAQKYVKICISDSIKHHQEILHLADDCEITFSWLLLLQFCGSSLLICMQLYQLSIYEIISIPFFCMANYLILMSVQIGVFCWYGNEVKLTSEQLSDVIFQCDWNVTDISTQKSLLLMMERSMVPIRLTAGKFIFLSLESWMSLLKGSASYFMFLKEMNKENV